MNNLNPNISPFQILHGISHIAFILIFGVATSHMTGKYQQEYEIKKNQRSLLASFVLLKKYISAQDETRTHTSLRKLGPEPSASTNSATWAIAKKEY